MIPKPFFFTQSLTHLDTQALLYMTLNT
jgi:hypothetical protein